LWRNIGSRQYHEEIGTVDKPSEWAKESGYHQSQDKARNSYAAKEGIPTVSSYTPSTKMLVQEARRCYEKSISR
ncbi:MAG: hypothetical protein V8Q83_00330, partial [Blautia sp.]